MLDIKEYLKQTKTVLLTQDAFDELMQRASAQPEVAKDTNVPNNDCISRRAVLAALTDISYNHCKTEGEAIVIDTAKTLVTVMPSAQPEIIRCKDCKHRLSSFYCEAWNNSPGFPCIGDEMFCSLSERRTDE